MEQETDYLRKEVCVKQQPKRVSLVVVIVEEVSVRNRQLRLQ
jgi:hypothetical protein